MGAFESRNTFEHIDKLSYEIGPRLAGSERSDQTSDYISEKFEEFGLKTKIQTFNFPNRLKKVKVMMTILIGLFAAALFLNLYINPNITFPTVIVGFGAAYFLPQRLLTKEEGKNVIGTLKNSKNPEKRIMIGAHYDSANCVRKWFWPILFRIFLPFVLLGFSIILIYSIFFGTGVWLESWLILAVPYFFVCTIPFWSYKGLVSPGAEDNASGVSVLLEAARVASEADIEDVEVEFVAFDAEEQELKGSKAYVEEGGPSDVFLNLDSLGSGDELCVVEGNGILRKHKTSPELKENIRKKLDGDGVWSPFSFHDHIPFLEEDVKAITLTSSNEDQKNRFDGVLELFFGLSNVRTNRLPKIHTIDDVPEEIKLENMETAGKIVLSLIGISNWRENKN